MGLYDGLDRLGGLDVGWGDGLTDTDLDGGGGDSGAPLTEDEFRNYLYAPDLPDPDLLIRTGGEMRISNFLLWQLSYSELYVTPVFWPDFDREDLKAALESFSSRDRRFGGLSDKK